MNKIKLTKVKNCKDYIKNKEKIELAKAHVNEI
jgi:hypothetical protein